MNEPRLRVRCACGWEVVGTEDEVVPATQEHGLRTHNMHATPDDVRAMAIPEPGVTTDPAAPTGDQGAGAG
jgi:hypothetical protein